MSASVPEERTGVSRYGHVGLRDWAGNAGFPRRHGLNNDIYDLTDWKLGANLDWQGMNLRLFYTGSRARDTVATAAGANPGGGDRFAAWGNRFGHNIANDSFWPQVRKTF